MKKYYHLLRHLVLFGFAVPAMATNYTVSTKADLQTRMNNAFPGDTVFVANGTYNNWGQIVFNNTNGTPASAKIVLKAQTVGGVIFTGTAYIGFRGTGIVVDGFTFMNGNAGTNAVVSFRSSSTNLSNYSRVTNITIDNFNTLTPDSNVENEWIGLYGTNNRVDHCTFINKANARATIVVWYSTNTTYPQPSVSTFHLIDSNYFKGRSYMGENGGETIRLGTSTTSRTDGFNVVEYNLFEDMTQTEPEIISSKSDFNTYRYNTFRNCSGGLTLRHGRYNDVYGNFFIVDNTAVTSAYGVRAIDKGHRIYNNYFEGLNGNASGGTSQLRAPVNLYNGESRDTTDVNFAARYFPADSCLVAFNTIVNARGGGGIVLGGTSGGTIQPTGIVLANNLVKMTTGSALYRNPANTALTFTSEGNIYEAPSGLGTTATGWQSATLAFGARAERILTAPTIVQDAAENTAYYTSLFALTEDVQGQQRSTVYDVGADELNGTGQVTRRPLVAGEVGAGTSATLPVKLISFETKLVGENVVLTWKSIAEQNLQQYEVLLSTDGRSFQKVGIVAAKNSAGEITYSFTHSPAIKTSLYYRLKMIDKDGSYTFSAVRLMNFANQMAVLLSPNPASGNLNVSFTSPIVIKDIAIIDAAGRIEKRSVVPGNNFQLDISRLQAGTYLLRLIDDNNFIHQQKFVVNP